MDTEEIQLTRCTGCGEDLNDVEWTIDPCGGSEDGTHQAATQDGLRFVDRFDKDITDPVPWGTFRVYDGETLIGYVLERHEPGAGPDFWNRPLGRQGCTAKGTWAAWAADKATAVAALVAAFRAENA